MRKYSMFLFILVLVILTACGTDDKEADQDELNEEQDVDVENIADEQNEDDEVTNKKESSSISSPTDTSGILDAAAEAMSQVTGMALEGEIEAHMEMSELVTMDETTEVTGKVTFNPYVEHLNYQTTSTLVDVIGESEYYLTDEAMYMHATAEEGWLAMPMSPDEFGSALSEAQFNNFSKHHDQFELSEENGNYLLSFEGDGDIYNEVMYGGIRDTWGEEGYEAITSIVEGVSGSYQLTIDKQTFHLVSLSHESETVDGEISNENTFSYEYSNFNEVDDIVVPEDVIESAQEIPGME